MFSDNEKRADRALGVVLDYADSGEPLADGAVDLLTDMMHMADRVGLDWAALVSRAEAAFEHEGRQGA